MNNQEGLKNWIYPGFWVHILDPPFGCTPTLLKPTIGGHLPYSNIKIEKLNVPTNLASFQNNV